MKSLLERIVSVVSESLKSVIGLLRKLCEDEEPVIRFGVLTCAIIAMGMLLALLLAVMDVASHIGAPQRPDLLPYLLGIMIGASLEAFVGLPCIWQMSKREAANSLARDFEYAARQVSRSRKK